MSESQKSESFYDGYALPDYFLRYAGILLTTITIGICYPFYVCWVYGYEINHTVIDGRRLKFTGTAGALFNSWIIRWILIICTFGIYSICIPWKTEKWCAENTVFADDNNTVGRFDSDFWPYFKVLFLYGLLAGITFGLLLPYAHKQIVKYEQEHKKYGSLGLRFDATGSQFYGTWILGSILSAITFGIYGVWFLNLIRKFITKHTHFAAKKLFQKNRFCTKCGKEIKEGTEFCTGCGTRLIK
ncbi:MAG: DUF898 family protein [Treponema sp.]|nr:DUF898 family protein [Treponema sp.]